MPRNAKLIAARLQRNLTQKELAKALGVTTRTIRGWESGTRPQPAQLRSLIAFMGVSSAENLGVPTSNHRGPRRSVTASTRSPEEPSHTAARSTPDRLTGDLEETIRECWIVDDERGATAMIPSVLNRLGDAAKLMKDNSFTTDERVRLQRATAELNRLAGWGNFDSNHYRKSTAYFLESLHLAREIEDRLLEANVLSCMSLQATYENSPTRALSLALAAHDATAGCNSPRVRALLSMRAAFAYAVLGDSRGCHGAISNAETSLARADQGTDDPAWSLYFDEQKMIADAGIARGRLGELQPAVELLASTVADTTQVRRRPHVFHLVWLAGLQLSAGDVNAACATAGRAVVLAPRLDSPRTDLHVQQFTDRLAPYADVRSVIEFRDLRADLSRSRN